VVTFLRHSVDVTIANTQLQPGILLDIVIVTYSDRCWNFSEWKALYYSQVITCMSVLMTQWHTGNANSKFCYLWSRSLSNSYKRYI